MPAQWCDRRHARGRSSRRHSVASSRRGRAASPRTCVASCRSPGARPRTTSWRPWWFSWACGGDFTAAPFLLTAFGLAATIAGPLLTSSLYAEPNYEVILSWDPQAVPEDWRIARARWLRLNWIRTALTLLALVLFSAATYLHVL
jgi:hypothetical protein